MPVELESESRDDLFPSQSRGTRRIKVRIYCMPRAYLGRSDPPELNISRARGSVIFDRQGRKYIDFVMGWCVGNLGWAPSEITRALPQFRGPDYVYPDYGYEPWNDLAG